jgi:hypothetical protein
MRSRPASRRPMALALSNTEVDEFCEASSSDGSNAMVLGVGDDAVVATATGDDDDASDTLPNDDEGCDVDDNVDEIV